MSLRTDIVMSLRANKTPTAPLIGGTVAPMTVNERLDNGTDANEADKRYMAQPTIVASGTLDIDLKTQVDENNVALALVEVVAIAIEVPSGGGALALGPGASNGWTALTSGTAPYVHFPAGANVLIYVPTNPAYAVGAANKVLRLTETGGLLSVVPKITIIGRSA